ncbi:MAG: branched-chain amino acid transport system ATP-binding protein [Parcubacteria group bacterium Gr01-1014_8]|nr:MAG: branched-chain amino acid transport system ATP-binding protein [Parcubacteria group bacterium Gr01-1014_8]
MGLLETRKLTKSFGGAQAVDHVDLSFEAGKITALIGPNGSGKTTLIHTITGMMPMGGGTVVISDSIELSKIAAQDVASYGITRTFQNSRLIQQMSVLDNVLFVLTERNFFGSLFERHGTFHLDAAEDILKKIGLWEKRDEKAENLSYGQRKLLEVARAVLMKANVYFFDEPFAGLFPEMRKTISDIMRKLKNAGAAVVLVEHDMELVRELADHCYVLDSGKVIAEGTPEQVLKQANVVEAYLGK